MTMKALFDRGATFSPDRKYRYKLWRVWDTGLPMVLFICLNPSTANENKDDPTVRRIIGFGKDWNYGGIYLGNLFAYCTSDPSKLDIVEDPVGPATDALILEMALQCEMVVVAWGVHGDKHGRGNMIIRELKRLHTIRCFGINANGQPKHPLYIPAGAGLEVM
jgi:hypothetical protein